jgi:hypothetical protein
MQAIQSGLNGIRHTHVHAGQTAKAAPDLAAGMKNKEIKASKIIFNFIFCELGSLNIFSSLIVNSFINWKLITIYEHMNFNFLLYNYFVIN